MDIQAVQLDYTAITEDELLQLAERVVAANDRSFRRVKRDISAFLARRTTANFQAIRDGLDRSDDAREASNRFYQGMERHYQNQLPVSAGQSVLKKKLDEAVLEAKRVKAQVETRWETLETEVAGLAATIVEAGVSQPPPRPPGRGSGIKGPAKIQARYIFQAEDSFRF